MTEPYSTLERKLNMKPLIYSDERFVLRCFAMYVLIGFAITAYNPGYGMFYFFGSVVVALWAFVLLVLAIIIKEWFVND